MAKGALKQASFTAGQISPLLLARNDLAKHQTGLKTARNVIPLPQGAFMKRPGTKWIWNTKVAADYARVFPFEYSTDNAYVVLAGDLKFRFIASYDLITEASQSITSITKANPAVVTYAGADNYANGDRVIISGGEMAELHNREFTVANVNAGANTFELSGVDSTSYTTYVSGGTVAEIYEITSPYTDDQLAEVTVTLGANVAYFFHPDVTPYKLTRTSNTAWTMTAVSFDDGPFAPVNSDPSIQVRVELGTTSYPGKSVTIYANSDIFTSSHVGSLFYMEEILFDQLDVSPWSASIGMAGVGTQISSNGNVYEVVETAGGSSGTVAPTHIQGDAWDTSSTAANRRKFRYLHSRYSTFTITAYTSAKQVTATIVSYCPPGFNQPSRTITGAANDGGGNIRITSAAHGYANGDRVYIASVGGTTEANGYWEIEDVATNTFDLKGSTFTNAYTAGGTSRRFATWLWAFGAFSAARGYPSCGTFYQDRLVMAATDSQPDSLWASVVGDYESFALKYFGTTRDDMSVPVTLASPRLDRIRSLSPDATGLLALTAGAEWLVRPATTTRPFAAGNVDAKPNSWHGSKAVQAVQAGSATLFVQRSGKKIMEAIFDAGTDRYVSNDLTLVENTITKGGVVEATFVRAPDNIVWMCRADGELIGLTYDREQQIAGFHSHALGGYSDASQTAAIVESVCSIPSPDGTRDDLYMVVKRYINGATVRTVEYMDRSWDIDSGAIEDQYFVDCGATYDGSSTSTVTGLYFLRGETVQVLVDGASHPDCVVSSTGSITLDRAGSVIQIGYGYNADGAMLPTDFAANDGSASGSTKKVSKLKVWFYRSATFDAGPDTSNLDPIVMREAGDDLDTATPLKTGIRDISWPDGYTTDEPVMVRQSKPMAMAVMALIRDLSVSSG